MTGTNHGMTGVLIALLVKEPALAVSLSFASHFACDALPHYGLKKGSKLFGSSFNVILVLDFVVAVSLMILFGHWFPSQRWLIWGCMVAAASPDLMWAYYNLYQNKIRNRHPKLDLLARFHAWIQWSQTPRGWFVEATWFVLIGSLILTQR